MNTYKCALCGEIYEKGWTDEEAVSERERNFPEFNSENCVLVCDDCYKQMNIYDIIKQSK